MNGDDEFWEDERRAEAEAEAAAEEQYENNARSYIKDNAAELAREFFDSNYEEAVQVFTTERLHSYYAANPEVAAPALRAFQYAQLLMPNFPQAALIFAASSTEQILKNALLRPILSGLLHAEDLASLVVAESTRQTGYAAYHKLLKGMLSEVAGFELETYKRVGSKQTLWEELSTILTARNGLVHSGGLANMDTIRLSLVAAEDLLKTVFPAILAKLGLHLHDPITISETPPPT